MLKISNLKGLKFICRKKYSNAVNRNIVKRRCRHLMRDKNITGLIMIISWSKSKKIAEHISFAYLNYALDSIRH